MAHLNWSSGDGVSEGRERERKLLRVNQPIPSQEFGVIHLILKAGSSVHVGCISGLKSGEANPIHVSLPDQKALKIDCSCGFILVGDQLLSLGHSEIKYPSLK